MTGMNVLLYKKQKGKKVCFSLEGLADNYF